MSHTLNHVIGLPFKKYLKVHLSVSKIYFSLGIFFHMILNFQRKPFQNQRPPVQPGEKLPEVRFPWTLWVCKGNLRKGR